MILGIGIPGGLILFALLVPGGRTLSPQENLAIQQLHDFQAYEQDVSAAQLSAGSDARALMKQLEKIIAAAQTSHLLPINFPHPTDGEQSLLRLYLNKSTQTPDNVRDNFIAYLRKEYPTFPIDAEIRLWQAYLKSAAPSSQPQ